MAMTKAELELIKNLQKEIDALRVRNKELQKKNEVLEKQLDMGKVEKKWISFWWDSEGVEHAMLGGQIHKRVSQGWQSVEEKE